MTLSAQIEQERFFERIPTIFALTQESTKIHLLLFTTTVRVKLYSGLMLIGARIR